MSGKIILAITTDQRDALLAFTGKKKPSIYQLGYRTCGTLREKGLLRGDGYSEFKITKAGRLLAAAFKAGAGVAARSTRSTG